MSNPFFINKGPFNISLLLKLLNSKTKIEKEQEAEAPPEGEDDDTGQF